MSIYSGFATRNQEQTYDQLIYDLVFILSKKIVKAQNKEQTDQDKFVKLVKQIFIKLTHMQKQKYLEPNMSASLYDLMQHFLSKENPSFQPNTTKQNAKWVKIKKDSQQQSFTSDTKRQSYTLDLKRHQNHKISRNQQVQVQPRGLMHNPNPQIKQIKRLREVKSSFESSLKLNSTQKPKYIQKISQRNGHDRPKVRHQSQRHFQGNYQQQRQNMNSTFRERNVCSQCKCSKNQLKSSNNHGIVMPQLVKEYIQTTNHNYMKNFRKRKVMLGSFYD